MEAAKVLDGFFKRAGAEGNCEIMSNAADRVGRDMKCSLSEVEYYLLILETELLRNLVQQNRQQCCQVPLFPLFPVNAGSKEEIQKTVHHSGGSVRSISEWFYTTQRMMESSSSLER